MGIQWWLSVYLNRAEISEEDFLDSFGKYVNADRKYVQEFLQVDADCSAQTLLAAVEKKPQGNTFLKIVQGMRQLPDLPSQHDDNVKALQDFHRQWQAQLRAQLKPYAEYHRELTEVISLLNSDGYPLQRLIRGDVGGDPVTGYLAQLQPLLLGPIGLGDRSTSIPSADLVQQVDLLLQHAKTAHMELIHRLAILLVYHYLPEKVVRACERQGVLIASSNPSPAMYRLLQNYRYGVTSGRCYHDPRKHDALAQPTRVRGAVPMRREALEPANQLNAVATHLSKGLDDVAWFERNEGFSLVQTEQFASDELEELNEEIAADLKTPDSRFLYGITPGVFDDDLAQELATSLPAVNHYAYIPPDQSNGDDDPPRVSMLVGFVTSLSKKIENRERQLRTAGDSVALDEISRLIEVQLQKHGNAKALGPAPKGADKTKWLKWVHEAAKADKSVMGILDRHPELSATLAQIYTEVTGKAAGRIEELWGILSNLK